MTMGSTYTCPIPGSCPHVTAAIIFLLLILSLTDGATYLALPLWWLNTHFYTSPFCVWILGFWYAATRGCLALNILLCPFLFYMPQSSLWFNHQPSTGVLHYTFSLCTNIKKSVQMYIALQSTRIENSKLVTNLNLDSSFWTIIPFHLLSCPIKRALAPIFWLIQHWLYFLSGWQLQ